MNSDYLDLHDYWDRFNETEMQSIDDLIRFETLLNTHSDEGLVGDISGALATIAALKAGQKEQVIMSHIMKDRTDGMEYMAAHLLNTAQLYHLIVNYLFDYACKSLF